MDIERAIELIEVIANGVDPFTGEVIDDGPLQHPDIIRALFLAVKGLENLRSKEEMLRSKDKASLKLRFNDGEPWSQADDEELLILFDSGMKTQELAEKYGRTEGSIRARLLKHGRKEIYNKNISYISVNPPSNPWTIDDDNELLNCFDSGVSQKELALKFNRSLGAIQNRLIVLGRKIF